MRGLLWSTWEDLGLLTSAFVLSWRLWLYLSPRTRPTQRHTDTASVAAYEQMFPGGTVDRSHWDHIEASARPHVFMCAVFSLCSLYVFGLKNTLGIGGVVFFFPSDCLFLHSSPLSRRWGAFQLHTSHRWTPRWPPAVGSVPLSRLCTIIPPPSLSLSHAPVSLPPELSVGISSPSTHPCVYAPAVLQRKFIN